MKWIGGICVLTAGILWGYLQFRGLHDRVTLWKQSLLFLRRWETVLRYQAIPLHELGKVFSNPSTNPEYLNQCIANLDKGLAFPEAWEMAVRSLRLDEREKQVLMGFGEGLGRSDIEGQLAHCRMYLSLWQEHYAEAKEDLEKKGKLFLLLGFSGGASIALLLL